MSIAMRTVAAAGLVVLPACSGELPPKGQYLLYVSTDAPVPPAADAQPGADGQPALEAPIPLFDRVLFELYPPGSDERCNECEREFAVDRAVLESSELSIGIVPQDPRDPPVARVRMYLDAVTRGAEPSVSGSVDAWLQLPPIDDDGIVELTVELPIEAVGTPLGSLRQPIDPEPGRPDPSWVGSWDGAERVPCAEPPPPGQACVPGGAFWMGHPSFAAASSLGFESDQRRIVVLSPFFIDHTEVTVAEFRASGLASPERKGGDPVAWDGTTPPVGQPRNRRSWCTYTEEPSERDELPVTCISRSRAAAYCASRGKRLPTEAQLEYLLGGLRGADFAWGYETPRCDEAVFGMAYTGQGAGDGSCRLGAGPAAPPAPLPPDSGERDRIELSGGTVVDISGNVSEWARDEWNRQDEPCWGTGVHRDPECRSASSVDGPLTPCKGGNWTEPPDLLHPAKRWGMNPATPILWFIAQVGFRCAAPDTE